ncbi:hypothetical protein ACH4SK_38870 [Streptomyces inhibens]|uniref:hypothetical protein n=1 Tax=Streptomyces inhibens TaxID=2293571 RepID=UPI0037914523
MVRNIEAVLLMARTDEVLVPAAWVNARAVFEHAVRILWLLDPEDPMARECRWLGMLADTERSHRLVADGSQGYPGWDGHRATAESIRTFRDGGIARLPDGYRPQKPPSFEAMLRSLNSAFLHGLYREGSQYVHGSMWGTESYRRKLGDVAEFGEFIRTQDWALPLHLCWVSLRNAGSRLLDRTPAPACDWEATDQAFEQGLRAFVKDLS